MIAFQNDIPVASIIDCQWLYEFLAVNGRMVGCSKKKKMDRRTYFRNFVLYNIWVTSQKIKQKKLFICEKWKILLIFLNQIIYCNVFHDEVFMGHCIFLFTLCNNFWDEASMSTNDSLFLNKLFIKLFSFVTDNSVLIVSI